MFILDLAERVGRTFVQAYFAVWTAPAVLSGKAPEFDTMLTLYNLKVGAAAAFAALLMGLGAKNVGDNDSASVFSQPIQYEDEGE